MSKGVRISDEAYELIKTNAEREGRSFIAQLDRELKIAKRTKVLQ